MENNNPPVPPNNENDINKEFNEQFGNPQKNADSNDFNNQQNKINQNVNPYQQHQQQGNAGGYTNQNQGTQFNQQGPYVNPGYQQHRGVPIPNATASLVLGIISLVLWICYGIFGLACAIIALILGSKAMKLYEANPAMYDLASYNNARAGKICGIIGLVIGSIYLMVIIVAIIFAAVGASAFRF